MSPVEVYLTQVLYGGHRTRLVRVRVGQAGFRSHLLKAHGDECAFTGPSPREALEAAHLYSFAADGEHRDDGGLLLRRDIHRLFDRGHLAVTPSSVTIDVSGAVRRYEEYGRLQGKPLRVSLTGQQVHWVSRHREMHRSG